MKKNANLLLTVLTCVLFLPISHSQGSLSVVIDGYTHNSTLTSGDSLALGTQVILVCQVVGLPYGIPLGYNWTCPNGSCEVEGYHGRTIYNEHILAVNTTSTSDGGTYACQVTVAEEEARGTFTLRVTGGRVVHSFGRLIPFEFPITDLQHISDPDGIGRITCTDSSGSARFNRPGGRLETGGLTQTIQGSTATLEVNINNTAHFDNRDVYCTNSASSYFYLFLSGKDPVSIPSLNVNTFTHAILEYRVERTDGETSLVITGYDLLRFGVPMIGEYLNTGIRRTATISPAVPGAQYRITAWALGDGRRSGTPAVETTTTNETKPSGPRSMRITKVLASAVEVNWLPPREPNGEVHYVIYYTAEDGSEQLIDTKSNLTHYNLTKEEGKQLYLTNISVQAVNSAGRSDRSALTAVHIALPGEGYSFVELAAVSLGTVVLLLVCVVLLAVALAVTATKLRRATRGDKGGNEPQNGVSTGTGMMKGRVGVCKTTKRSKESDSSYYNISVTARGEEEERGMYVEVRTEGISGGKITSQSRPYQELDVRTLERNEYEKLKGDRTSIF